MVTISPEEVENIQPQRQRTGRTMPIVVVVVVVVVVVLVVVLVVRNISIHDNSQ